MIRVKKEAKSVDFRKYKNMSTSQIAKTLMGHVLSDIEDNKVNECRKLGESVNRRDSMLKVNEKKSLKKEAASYEDGRKAILDIANSLPKLRDGLFYLNDMKDHPESYRKRNSYDLALQNGKTQYEIQADTVKAIDTIRKAIEVAAERYFKLEDYFLSISGD